MPDKHEGKYVRARTLHVEDFEIGMRLASDFKNSEGGLVFPQETVLTEKNIEFIRNAGTIKLDMVIDKEFGIFEKLAKKDRPDELLERLQKTRVLIVDDQEIMRRKLREIVESVGVSHIEEAENGKLAVDKAKDFKPHVVTLDIEMPIQDGTSSIKPMLKDFPDTKIIMVSSLSLKEKVTQCILNGAVDFIAKPYTEERVLKTFTKVVNSAMATIDNDLNW